MKNITIILLTTLIVGGGMYFWQQKSNTDVLPSELVVSEDESESDDSAVSDWVSYKSNKGFSFSYPSGHGVSENPDPENPEVTNVFIVKTNADGSFVEGVTPSLQINVSEDDVTFALWEGIPWAGYPEIMETFKRDLTKKESVTSLPAGVQWLTYKDDDLSFVYPKTFLDTPLQESNDKNLAREQWEVSRQDDIVYIKPNFESPAAEFGATYEIQIIDNSKDAVNLHTSIENGTTPKNLCQPLNAIQISGYSVCAFEKEVDKGLGRTGKYYAVIPELNNGSQTPPWLYIFDGSGGRYSDYINSILLPNLGF